jgi:hypothetical protein
MRRRLRSAACSLLLLAVAAALGPPQAWGQPTAGSHARFDSLVAAHSYEIRFEEGSLSGPGADWLVRQGRKAHYFLVGERHGTAQIPRIVGSLYNSLSEDGPEGDSTKGRYGPVALEIGPIAGRKAASLLRQGGYRALEHFLTSGPGRDAIAFLNIKEEARLASRFVEAGAPLWGLDQEFMYSGPWHLSRLCEMARTDRQRSLVDSLQAVATTNRRFVGTVAPAVLDRLDRAFEAHPDSAVHRTIGALQFTNGVYRAFTADRPLARANVERENHMKETFLARYRHAKSSSASAPKVFFKFGALHTGVLIDRFGRSSLGTFIEEWAFSKGQSAFNLMIGCNGGDNLSLTGGDFSPKPCRSVMVGRAPLDSARTGPSEVFARLLEEHRNELWLVDLRPLRTRLDRWDLLGEPARKYIRRFDAFLAVPGVSSATLMEGAFGREGS